MFGRSKLMTCETPVDVDAARRDVGRHQHRHVAAPEVAERSLARAWDLLPWIAAERMPRCRSCSPTLVGAVLGAREDERAIDGEGLEELLEHAALVRLRHEVDRLLDLRRAVDRDRRDRDAHGVREHGARQRLDVRAAWSPRTSASVACGGTAATILRTSWMKPMSSIVVGLVEHQDLDAGERDEALLHEVEQAARRRDHDRRAGAQSARS